MMAKQISLTDNQEVVMNERILIVDDERDILKFLSIVLEREGFQVKIATGGEKAMDIFRRQPCEVVISDIRMPGMDGMELMKCLKAMDEDVEVIILTGFVTLDNAITSLKDGAASDYLIKPLESIDDLLVSINRALEKRKFHIKNRTIFNELKKAKAELEHKVAQRVRDLKRVNGELADRARKLNCLFDISHICQKTAISPEEMIQQMLDAIPPAFRHPDICCARAVFSEGVFQTIQFKETPWKLDADICNDGKKIGVLEIRYLEMRPGNNNGPFLREEGQLVRSIAWRMGELIEKRRPEFQQVRDDLRERAFTFCSLHTEPAMLKENAWEVLEVLQQNKRGHDFLGMGKSGQVT